MEPTNPELNPQEVPAEVLAAAQADGAAAETSEDTPVDVVPLNINDLPKTIKAILQFVKDAPNAVNMDEVYGLHLPYTKTALFFLSSNRYLKYTSEYKVKTNPHKTRMIGELLASE